jgi:pimeloyl-ACP methyl ester carboxylesterase
MRAPAASKVPVAGGELWVEACGDGFPTLFVAGLGQGSWAWRDVVPELSGERGTIVFDARGTGRSSRPAVATIEDMVRDATAVLDSVGAESADVVGLSMGGYVALTLALAAPARVRILVLAGTGAGGPDRVPRPADVRDAFNAALALPYEDFVRRTLQWAFAPAWAASNPERLEEIVARRLEHPAGFETTARHADACYRYYDRGCEVERIDAPALVVHGGEDRIVPVENGRRLAARLPRAEYVELAGAGHNLPLEDPGGFVRLVRDFTARV